MKATHFLLENYEALKNRKKRPEWSQRHVQIIRLAAAIRPEIYEPVPIKVLHAAPRAHS